MTEPPAPESAAALVAVNGVEVVDTFAEAFPMTAARAIVTADTPRWAEIAARTMSGYATSVIACDAEAAHRAAPGARTKRPTAGRA